MEIKLETVLIDALQEEDFEVRMYAREALKRTATREAAQALRK
jgi:HEAT repeat protein